EGTTKIGRSDSDQDQDIGALVVLGKSHKFRFNHPAEAAVLRQRRSINDVSPIWSCGALDWLNLDGSHTLSPHYILSSIQNKVCTNCKEKKRSPEISRDIDTVHEEYKKKLKEQEAFHRKQIQQQQLYVEDLKQQILRGQVKAERELENDQALINQQILENQQWLINESNRLAALQQQQREFAVQTESTPYAEAEVQSSRGLEVSPSLLQQNKKRLVQLELLRRCSLKKAERNIRRKKVKFQLERIVKKQKLLEAKQNLEQLEANCWLSEVRVKQSHIPNENIAVQASLDHQLQKRRSSLGSSYALHSQHSFCNLHLPQVPSCLLNGETISKLSTSPNIDLCSEGNTPGKLSSVEYRYRKLTDFSRSDDLNDEKGISFLVQMQLSEKQKISSFGNKKGAESDSDSAVMAHIDKNDQKMEKLDDSTGQAGCQKQTSKGSCPDHYKEKNEPETFITGTRMTKTKVLGDLSQPANSFLEQNRAQVSNKETRMGINAKGHSSSPENFNKMKKAVVYGNLPSAYPDQAAKNLKREPASALQNHENPSVEHQEFLMVATSVGNLTKMNTQAPLSYVEKKWHSAELLSAGMSKTATDVLGNWQEDEENEISDTDSTYSVDSLSCAYAKAFTEKLKQDDFHRNKCLANPEDSESDDSQMSQDSLIEKENKAKRQNKSQFQKLKARHQPAKLYKSRSEHRVSSLVTSYASRRRLGEAERSFSLDSLGDGEEVPTEDAVEESKSDSSDEVPAEIFWKLQTPRPPTVQTEEDHESKICSRDTNYNLKLTSSFYLDTKQQPASSNACKQFLKDAKVSFAVQERSLDRRLHYATGNPLLTTDAWSSYDSKVEISSPRITAPPSHEHLQFQDARFYSLNKPKGWLKKDDLKQSAAEVSFVSGSKQIHSITRLSHGIKEINASFSSDTSEVPLPETTAACRGFESEECTNADENSSLESQDVTSTFVSSVGPSSSFVHISVKPDYYEHSRANHPEQEQISELSTYRSTTECTQAFSCLESFSTADCLSPIPRKEEDSLPTTHPELLKDHKLKRPPLVSVLPVHILEQVNSCVEADLEDSFLRTIEKDDLDDDCNNLVIESKITDSNTGSTSVSASAAGSSTKLAYNVTSTQATAVKQVHFGNRVQLFPRREIPTRCDESFFLSDLTNNKCSPGSTQEHQVLAGQGAESAVEQGLFRSRESNLEAMHDTDYEQIPAEVATVNTDLSSQKITYKCNPLVIAYSATPIEICEKEKICMETSTDSLSEIVSEEPSLREKEEHEPKDEDLSSLNNYEFKSKPVSKNHSYGRSLADSPVSCLSQHISENSTLCVDNIREERSESKEHGMLTSQVVDQKEFSSKYKNLLVNEVSYLTVNVNGQDTESFPAAVCENTADLLPESNSSIFYKASPKANFFQSASETENYDTLLEHVTIVKGDCDATSNHTVEARATESCSVIHSSCLCTTCSSTSVGENNMCKMTGSSVESDATIPLETETKNKFLIESREEKEAFSESDCPEDVLLVEDHFNSELGRVFEYNTDTLGTVSQEVCLCIDKESKFLRNPEADPEETVVPYQNTKANTEEMTKLKNSANSLEKNGVEMKSREMESVPEYPVAKVQSVTADRSGENFKGIDLSQNPKKPIDIVDSEVQCEFYTNLHLTLEEAKKDELQVGSTSVEHTQESEALVHSDNFFQKEESEKIISINSPELSVSPQSSPSAMHSHRRDPTQNAQGLPDACEGLLLMNRTRENVFNTDDIDTTELITDRQGNILEKKENEEKIDSSNLTEHYVLHCLPHEDFDQENKVNVCEVTGSEEQVVMTNTDRMVIMNQEDIHTDENILFTEESPGLHQMYCNRDDKEEILNQFKIPERYLTPSGLGENILSVDDSQYHSPLEMNEDGGSEDSATDTRNTAMEDTDVYDYSVDDNISNDQYRFEEESKSLHIKENSHAYMSCSTRYPEHGASENLNISVVRRPEICGLDAIDSGIIDEKAHLKAVDKTEKQMFLENREEIELIVLQSLNELFPESKDSCHDDNRLNEILRESQWVSTSFSTNNGDNSKQQNSAATLKPTKNIQGSSVKDSLCPSVNHLLCLEVSDNSHLVQDVAIALKGHTKPSNGSVGTEAVLYYETLMENETSVGTPLKTVNKEGDNKAHSDKIQSKNEAFLQNMTAKDRQEEDLFVFRNDYSASERPVNENNFSMPCEVGSHEPEMVELKQGTEGNSFSSEELDSSEDIIEGVNSHEEHSVDLMINKISKDCFNSTERKDQEEKDTIMPDELLFNNSSLLSSSEKEAKEGMGEKTKHSLLEISSQNIFHNINTAETELHSGSSSQCDNKEKCSNTNYTITSSNNDNAKFPDIKICQSEPRRYQGRETSKDCWIDYPEITVSENTSTVPVRLPNYKRNSCTCEHSAGLLNSSRSFANDLTDSCGEKCKNDALLSEETKYFESESTVLSAHITFSDVSQKGDEKDDSSAVTEATDAQSNKIPEEAVGTDQEGKIIQDSFQNCNDTKENKMPEYLEHYSNSFSVTIPESGVPVFQSLGKTGSEESKCAPPYFAENAPSDILLQNSRNVSVFNACLLNDSKSLTVSQLEVSLQDTFLTEQVSSSSADLHSVKEDFPQAFAELNSPSMRAFSESSAISDIDHGETGTCDRSHTSILKHSPLAVLQMQDTQSDKSVVFDEPIHASGIILLSLAKANKHYPVSDTNSASYENSAVDVEPVYGSNCQQLDNDTEGDQHHWSKVPAQKACTERAEKVPDDSEPLVFSSIPLWDTGRSVLVKEGQMRKVLNRNEEELHSSAEVGHFAVKKKQGKTVDKEHLEKQTNVSSNLTNELTVPQVLEHLYSGDANVDPEHTYDSFGPAHPTNSRSTDPRQLYHSFEKSPADLQGTCQYVSMGDDNTDDRKEILLCKSNAGSNVHADSFSTTEDDIMKSERPKFSLMNNESTPVKFLPTNHGLPSQESKLVQFRSRRPCSTTHNTKNCKTEHRPYLQSHRLSAPALPVFSDLDDTFRASSLADSLLYSASRSLQDLNMSVEPPSPTEDDLHVIEKFSKQESKNILQVKSKARFQQRMTQTKKIANCDPKNLQNYAARTQSSQSLKDSTVHSPSLLPTAHSSVGAKEDIHSKSSSVAQCSEGRVEEAGYQPGTDLFSQDSKDAMRFSSSDINPYIHPWQQEESCKIGWKQYVFGSASDVSCHQMPLNLDNRKVTRCSSVDNGLNSQNSPFHSHLSSYATAKVLSSTLSSIEGLQGWDNARPGFESTFSSDSNKQYSNVSIETLETNPENDTAKLKNTSAHPGNSSVQVDEIVLLYPSESERSSKKSPGNTCEQGTQTVATARYKRQRRHQRSYTDVSARRRETNKDLFQQHSSWTSMQNLSMHLSQLIQNTSELLGNLSQQNIIDNEQNIRIYQRRTEEGAKATSARSDSCTQTTADIGTQTEILEESQSKYEEKQVQAKSENELRAAKAVNSDFNGISADIVDKVPKRKEKTFSLEERPQEGTEMRNLGNTDFHDSLDSILEDSFMCLPLLHRTSTSTLDFQRQSLNAQQNTAPASARVSSITSSSVSLGQDDSSCTVVSSPTSSTFQSPSSYAQDKRSFNELEMPAERKLHYKNTLLVDRASSPILTLSASPRSQNAFSKPFCPIKEPFGSSSDASSSLHSQRKQKSGPRSGMEPHVDNFSQTETDSECGISRDSKGIRNASGSFLDKKAAKKLLGNDDSKAVEQQHRLTVGAHTTICAKRLYHSSSTLEVSDRTEFLTDDVRDPSPLAHSLRCMYVTGGGRSVLGGIRNENYVGNSDTALIRNHSPPDSDLLFNPKLSATCSSQANFNEPSEPLVGAASLQFHDLWKNENSCSLLSDVSNAQISLQNDNTNSITETEHDTESPLKKSTTLVKPYRPRSYSLRDLPIHNKFSNWCGVKGSPPTSSLSLSGSATDLHSQAGSKPGSQQAVEIEGKSQLWGSRSREIERLQRERAQIMSGIHLDLHQHPLTVELTEAKLNYGIGETDALLRVLQSGTADDLMAVPVKQQLYERHMRTIETLRKEREKRLQRYHRSRSLSPQKHLSLLQTLDTSHRDLDLPSRRREYLQQLRRDVVENTRVQEPKRSSIQYPSEIELMLRDYQKAREETKTEIARARDKLRERAEQEKRRIREQIFAQLQKEEARLKTLASTSTLCTESSLSLSSGPTSGYNSSNTATYTASKLSSWEGQVMAACSHNLRNLYTCQAAAGWKYQCTEKEVLVYYKVFPSATKHGFLGAGVIERPLAYVWGLVRDPGKRHLYDRSISTARIHKKITSHIQLVYLVTDTSLCYLQQPRDFCCITVEAKEKNLSVLAIQSVYDASMPHPCKDVVRGEILPSAWILEPDVVNGRDITRVIYMAQVDLGAPAIPAQLLSSIAKRQPLVIARLAHFLAS
ncbi:hypothetical protein CIB84_000693, partial [Bambusicola thoracicus]